MWYIYYMQPVMFVNWLNSNLEFEVHLCCCFTSLFGQLCFHSGILLPFPAGINALFSHGPRRSAGLARVYALWNLTSLINVVVAFICGYVHYNTQSSSKKIPNFQPWSINMDDSEWWVFPVGLVVCKCIQARLINWHVANLEIQDRSLYSNDFELFWQSWWDTFVWINFFFFFGWFVFLCFYAWLTHRRKERKCREKRR